MIFGISNPKNKSTANKRRECLLIKSHFKVAVKKKAKSKRIILIMSFMSKTKILKKKSLKKILMFGLILLQRNTMPERKRQLQDK